MSVSGPDMSAEKLSELLAAKFESEELDYKLDYDSTDQRAAIELTRDISAIANTRGGYIIFGVRDGDFAPLGVPPRFHFESTEIQNKVSKYFRPLPNFVYSEKTLRIDDANVKFAMIGIEASDEIVVSTADANFRNSKGQTENLFPSGTIFVRRGTETVKADPDALRTLVDRIAQKGMAKLTKIPAGRYLDTIRASQLNNLRRPDYVEFVGRETYLNDIMTKLGQRFFVVSIDGVGGVGKTALAQEISFRSLQQKSFDAVIWISAKMRALQLTGIKDIVPSLTNYEDLLNTVLDVFGFGEMRPDSIEKKEKKVKELLQTARCLLVIDNLETVEDERIFDFIKDLPDPSKALITSRKRLGEVERIVHLKEMVLTECKELVLQDGRSKSVTEILESPDRAAKIIFEATGGVPLAIRWVVGWAGQGGDVESVCRRLKDRSSTVLEFCFNEIYESILNNNSKRILRLMPIFSNPPDRAEIEAASSVQGTALDTALEQLISLSLLNDQIEKDVQGELVRRFTVLPLTLSFAQSRLAEDRGLEVGARKSLGLYLSRRQKESEAITQYGYALQNVGATTERGKLAALQAQLAFAAYQRGNYPESVKIFKQAVQTDANLSFTFQLWATVERQEGNVGKAEELFREAVRLNPGNPVTRRAWAMMRKEVGDLDGARRILSEALSDKPADGPTIHSIAVLDSQRGNFETADQLFQKALIFRAANYQERRQNVYTHGAMAENYRRWGENEEERQNMTSALDKYDRGLAAISRGLEIAPQEWRLINNRIRLNRSVARLKSKTGDYTGAEYFYQRAMYFSPKIPRELRHNSEVAYSRALNFAKMRRLEDATRACRDSLRYWDNRLARELRDSLMREEEQLGV